MKMRSFAHFTFHPMNLLLGYKPGITQSLNVFFSFNVTQHHPILLKFQRKPHLINATYTFQFSTHLILI